MHLLQSKSGWLTLFVEIQPVCVQNTKFEGFVLEVTVVSADLIDDFKYRETTKQTRNN